MSSERPLVLVDEREKKSGVVEELQSLGVAIRLTMLEIGDYAVAPSVVFERKTLRDFLSSLFDGRLFKQAVKYSQRALPMYLVVEGAPEELYDLAPNPKAYYGALATLLLSYRASAIFTEGPRGTALLLEAAARRVQRKSSDARGLRHLTVKKKTGQDLREQQLQVVGSLPNVGAKRAELLLRKFGSPRGVFAASKSELASILDKRAAEAISEILDTPYSSQKKTGESGLEQFF